MGTLSPSKQEIAEQAPRKRMMTAKLSGAFIRGTVAHPKVSGAVPRLDGTVIFGVAGAHPDEMEALAYVLDP